MRIAIVSNSLYCQRLTTDSIFTKYAFNFLDANTHFFKVCDNLLFKKYIFCAGKFIFGAKFAFAMRFQWVLLFSFGIIISAYGQFSPQEQALQLYEEGKYSEALPIFKRMVTLFPKDAKYQYYSGACMVLTNTELKTAINYLLFASEKPVPRNVYFFLGKAYHYTYQFDEALSAYLKFEQFGDRAEKEKWQCEMHINMARNGKTLLEKTHTFEIFKADTIDQHELFSLYNKYLKNGKFIEKSVKSSLFSESKGRSTWCYLPALLDNQQFVYESLTGVRKSKDLYQTKLLQNDEWSRPEKLDVLNTPFDEDYVFFNTSESALYFSSKGHNSMGGYDIFKSVFNPDTKSWSAPVNLGFPFNTPYDDFLFVPSDDQTHAYFASNRETSGSKLIVYTISFADQYPVTDLSPNIDFASMAHLLPSKPVVKKTPEVVVAAKTVKTPKPVSHSYPEELNQDEYNNLLNAAMRYQLKSDSLNRIAEDLRQRIQVSKSDEEKDYMKKEAYSLQQSSKAIQHRADELYEKVRAYEEKASHKNTKNDTSSRITSEMVKNALKTKNNDTSVTLNEKAQIPEKNTEKLVKPTKPIVIYEFKVMAKSPYSASVQIPINHALPAGLIYQIQLGAFSKPVEPERFKGIVPIYGETLQHGNITKYYAGLFNRMSDAEKALNKIREYGFKDAYIVSYYNGKNIPINRAKELEKEKI